MSTPLESVLHSLENQIAGLRTSSEALIGGWDSFERVLSDNPIERPDLQGIVEHLHSTWQHALDEMEKEAVEKNVPHVVERLSQWEQQVNQHVSAINQDAHQWSEVIGGLHTQLQQLPQELERDCHQSLTQAHQELGQLQSGLDQRLQTVSQDLQTTHKNHLDSVANSLQPTFVNECHNWIQGVQQHCQQDLPGFIQHADQVHQTASHSYSDLIDQSSSDLQEQLTSLLGNLGQHVTGSIQSGMENSAKKIIEECLVALVEEGEAAVMDTTFGAEITGALSPVLPELIVVYKATEVIKDAIHIFKQLEDGLGIRL